MSAPSGASPPIRRGFRVRPVPPSSPVRAWASSTSLIGVSRWSAYAWGAIGVTLLFIALTCWWLTQDSSIPIYDAGAHLETVIIFHDMLRSGDLLGPFNYESPYPPFATAVGVLATFIGGVNVAAPIVGENLFFVSLLTLGVYQIGRLLFGARAGLLAVVFVLGSPLLIAQFHVFMLDTSEAALVAVSIWLLLACEDFSRAGFTALAGVAVGIGLLVKVQYPPFVAGIVLTALLRGGWRNRRGLITFAVIALILAAPWYLDHLAQLATFKRDAGPHEGVPLGDTPPTLSLGNFAWYFWNMLNSQFLAPLFALIVGGTAWMAATLLRHRREAWAKEPDPAAPTAVHSGAAALAEPGGSSSSAPRIDRGPFGARLELFAGAVVAWLLITLTPSHDIRYGIPMMPYLAVIATGWIFYLPRPARLLAIAVVVLGVSANTLSTTFGLGGAAAVALRHPLPAGEEHADEIRFYTSEGFLVAGPRRDGDIPGLLEALRKGGVEKVTWGLEQSRLPDFSFEGLYPLARISKLAPVMTQTPEYSKSTRVATLVHQAVAPRAPPACARLSDGTGVWVVRYDTSLRKLSLYCPTLHPQFYDPGLGASPR
jgi:4-amino-4-deoxy-L-arabinose transferase-like glycosyltransferase